MGNFNPFALPDDLWSLPKSDFSHAPLGESLFQQDLEKLLQLEAPIEAALNPETKSIFPASPWGDLYPPLSFPRRETPPQDTDIVEKSETDSGIGISEEQWLDAASSVSEDKVIFIHNI
ncbi:hypothetical protein AA313_de0201612 [Arthrobotrys entomopaga]|nr:hypothetical protein AA313_de0201612 [Arthrobotrys entomopaga]